MILLRVLRVVGILGKVVLQRLSLQVVALQMVVLPREVDLQVVDLQVELALKMVEPWKVCLQKVEL